VEAAKAADLPVLGNAASAHTWAAQVSRRTGYRAPLSVEGTRKIDNILLHRIWGPLLFLAVVIGVFEVVFSIGQPLSDGFGDILARIGDLARPLLPAGWLQSLVLDGAWKGVCSVLVFPPPDPSAFSLHRNPRRLRLPGPRRADRRPRHAHHRPEWQSLHPAALRLRLRRPRHHGHAHHREPPRPLATILVTPFMTCSARLPVYLLLIAAFIPTSFSCTDFSACAPSSCSAFIWPALWAP
jgi:ferrous iron transport protein B